MLKLLKVMVAMAGAGLTSQVLGMFTNKILAEVMGPAGVGMYGLYRQLVDMIGGLTAIGSGAGLVQAMSSTEGEEQRRRLAAAMVLNALAIVATTAALIFLAPIIAREYFIQPDPAVVAAIRWLALPVMLVQISLMAYNFVSASRAFKLLGIVMVTPALASLIFSYPLATLAAGANQWGYLGLLIVPPALQLILVVPILRRLGWLRQVGGSFRAKLERASFFHYLRFHASAVVVSLASALAFLILPPLLIVNYGHDANGFFRTAWTLGNQNLTVMLSAFGAYLFPVLSSAKTDEERHGILNDASVVGTMLTLPLVGGLIIFQPLVIRLLYNKEFLPAIDMLHWLLLANYFVVVEWLFVTCSTSRAHTTVFVVVHAGFYLGFLAIGWLSVGFPQGANPIPWLSGIRGLGFAYFFCEVIVVAIAIGYTRWRYGYFPERRTALVWLAGLAVVIFCEAMTWGSLTVDWTQAVLLTLLCCVTPLMLLDARRRTQIKQLIVRLLARRANSGTPS